MEKKEHTTHILRKMYICQTCDKDFKWKSCFQKHLQRKWPCRKTDISCSKCNKKYISKQSLDKHQKLYCKAIMKTPAVSVPSPPTNSNSLTLSSLFEALYNNNNNNNNNFNDDNNNNNNNNNSDTAMAISFKDLLKQFSYSPSNMNALETIHEIPSAPPTPPPTDISQASSPISSATATAVSAEANIMELDALIDEKVSHLRNDAIGYERQNAIVIPSNQNDVVEKSIASDMDIHKPPLENFVVENPELFMGCNNDNNNNNNNNNMYVYQSELAQNWIGEILGMNNTLRNRVPIKDGVSSMLNELLTDGLISQYEYSQTMHINTMFARLFDLLSLGIYNFHKKEIITILLNLFELGKINKTVFINICLGM